MEFCKDSQRLFATEKMSSSNVLIEKIAQMESKLTTFSCPPELPLNLYTSAKQFYEKRIYDQMHQRETELQMD